VGFKISISEQKFGKRALTVEVVLGVGVEDVVGGVEEVVGGVEDVVGGDEDVVGGDEDVVGGDEEVDEGEDDVVGRTELELEDEDSPLQG
jgi:hypothetical protein